MIAKDLVVFVDESAMTPKMLCLYGQALRGLRAHTDALHVLWGMRTRIVALFGDGQRPCMSFDAATTAEIFYQYVGFPRPRSGVAPGRHRSPGQPLQPQAPTRDGHRLSGRGSNVAQCQSHLSEAGRRTSEALDEAICIALESIMAADAAGWLTSCGHIIP